MAILGNISNIRVGTLRAGETVAQYNVAQEVRLTKEVLPFEMREFTRTGLETKLAATSLLWSSQNTGVVLRDPEGLFHAVETNFPRPKFGKNFALSPLESYKDYSFDFVGFVALRKVILRGLNQLGISSNPCFISSNLGARLPETKAGIELQTKIEKAVQRWK